MSFVGGFGDKYGRKLVDTATKTGIDAAKAASKRVVQKTAETTGYLIGNEITDKITSASKSKEADKAKKTEEIYIPPEKRQQTIDDLKLFWHCIKMEYKKIVNLLDTVSDDKDLPRFVTKNGLRFMINQKDITMSTKKLELKNHC